MVFSRLRFASCVTTVVFLTGVMLASVFTLTPVASANTMSSATTSPATTTPHSGFFANPFVKGITASFDSPVIHGLKSLLTDISVAVASSAPPTLEATTTAHDDFAAAAMAFMNERAAERVSSLLSFLKPTAENIVTSSDIAIAKVKTATQTSTQMVAKIKPSIPKPVAAVADAIPSYTFTHTLEAGMIDPGVLVLQKFLNAEGFTIASTGDGSPGNETDFFGVSTRQALINFQNAHAAILLMPFGQTEGDGILSGATESYINAQLAAHG